MSKTAIAPAPPRTLLEQLREIANNRVVTPDGTVARLADAWVEGLGDRATPGLKTDVATALRSRLERQRADLLSTVVLRVR
jgi:hypothetical protein